MASWQVGERIAVDGQHATVLFVGDVPPTAGEWLGVSWDDAARGRHDGLHDGVRYFTAMGPTGGSFVRPNKVVRAIDVMAGIRSRYGAEAAAPALELRDAADRPIVVQAVGFAQVAAQQGCLDLLREVVLTDMPVGLGGDVGALVAALPRLASLDISHTLFSQWAAIHTVASALPNLRSLRCDHNRLTVAASAPPSTLRLTALYLNFTPLPWAALEQVLASTLELHELYLCHNGITELPPRAGGLPRSLRILDLSGNHLSDWDQIDTLQDLAALEILLLNDNHLPDLQRPPLLSAVKSLSLCNNACRTWATVSHLQALASLRDLRFKGNPVLAVETPLAARHLLTARLPQVRSLNGSDVCLRERTEAERWYLARHAAMWGAAAAAATLQPGSDALTKFYTGHPTFEALIAAHGVPDVPVASASSLKDSTVCLRVRVIDAQGAASVIALQVPRTTTVGRLRQVLRAKKMLPPSANARTVTLAVRADDGVDAVISAECPQAALTVLDDDLRELAFYQLISAELFLS